MKRINFYTIQQVKEKGVLYDSDNLSVLAPEDGRNLLNKILNLQYEACEKFGILTLNTKNVVVGVHVLSMGSLNMSVVHPREVFKAAMLNNASSIICFHNHPSGDPTPSPEDIGLTKRLVEAGNILGIQVLDHLIIGIGNRFVSMSEKGLM